MKLNRNIAVAIITGVLGLILGVTLGARLHSRSGASSPQAPKVAAVSDTISRVQPANSSIPAKPVAAEKLAGVKAAQTPKPALVEPPVEKLSPVPAPITAAPQAALPADAPVVCIDPGHPSETSDGAHAHGLSENKLNWEVALKLRPRLEAMGMRCILTKDSVNQRVTNRERAEIANHAHAKVLVRLHCDVGSGHGYTWYYPDRSGHKYGVSGPPKSVQRGSRNAAYTINETMKTVLKGHLRSNEIKTDASTFVGGKQGGVLTGSIFARVPTALIEMCYINQKGDAQFIASQAGQDLMAEALAKGIYAYVER